jgi:hypothetical protein
MPIECKMSNASTSSVKRLNNDAAPKASGVKATRWKADPDAAASISRYCADSSTDLHKN